MKLRKSFYFISIIIFIALFFTKALPALYPYLMKVEVYKVVQEKEIDSGALFYTESDESINMERKILKQ